MEMTAATGGPGRALPTIDIHCWICGKQTVTEDYFFTYARCPMCGIKVKPARLLSYNYTEVTH